MAAVTATLISSSPSILLNPILKTLLPFPPNPSMAAVTATLISSSPSILLNPNPKTLLPFTPNPCMAAVTATLISSSLSILLNPNPKTLLPFPPNPSSVRFFLRRRFPSISASLHLQKTNPNPYPILPTPKPLNPDPFLSSSTQTLTSIFALAKLLLSRFIPAPPQISQALSLSSPLFFAALRDLPSGYLNTPLTVVASGMAKWLDIYSGVLMVRVLLTWFPNIPWDKQPLSAIRDLCDPYLNLFRNIIPPVFGTLDVSPLLAFAVLGTLGSILNSSRAMR